MNAKRIKQLHLACEFLLELRRDYQCVDNNNSTLNRVDSLKNDSITPEYLWQQIECSVDNDTDDFEIAKTFVQLFLLDIVSIKEALLVLDVRLNCSGDYQSRGEEDGMSFLVCVYGALMLCIERRLKSKLKSCRQTLLRVCVSNDYDQSATTPLSRTNISSSSTSTSSSLCLPVLNAVSMVLKRFYKHHRNGSHQQFSHYDHFETPIEMCDNEKFYLQQWTISIVLALFKHLSIDLSIDYPLKKLRTPTKHNSIMQNDDSESVLSEKYLTNITVVHRRKESISAALSLCDVLFHVDSVGMPICFFLNQFDRVVRWHAHFNVSDEAICENADANNHQLLFNDEATMRQGVLPVSMTENDGSSSRTRIAVEWDSVGWMMCAAVVPLSVHWPRAVLQSGYVLRSVLPMASTTLQQLTDAARNTVSLESARKFDDAQFQAQHDVPSTVSPFVDSTARVTFGMIRRLCEQSIVLESIDAHRSSSGNECACPPFDVDITITNNIQFLQQLHRHHIDLQLLDENDLKSMILRLIHFSKNLDMFAVNCSDKVLRFESIVVAECLLKRLRRCCAYNVLRHAIACSSGSAWLEALIVVARAVFASTNATDDDEMNGVFACGLIDAILERCSGDAYGAASTDWSNVTQALLSWYTLLIRRHEQRDRQSPNVLGRCFGALKNYHWLNVKQSLRKLQHETDKELNLNDADANKRVKEAKEAGLSNANVEDLRATASNTLNQAALLEMALDFALQ